MLKGLLEKSSCAKCRICCGFDQTDIWEMPVFSKEAKEKLEEKLGHIEFIRQGDSYTVKPSELHGEELFYCPALDRDTGCILGDEKPFDCRIWPYRIMEVGGERAITISPVCPELYSRPLNSLVEFLERGLKNEIFSYADKNPDVVKPYDKSYPVLMFE